MQQVIEELFKPVRWNFPRRKYVVKGINDLHSTDLADFRNLAAKNKNYKYLLVDVNAFSKKASAVPLKDKKGKTVADAYRKIIRANPPFANLESDRGSEFKSHEFQKLMKEYNINLYHSHSVIKASFSERLIRTLKRIIYKEMALRGSQDWVSILPECLDKYNNSIHSSIKMKPSRVTKADEKRLLKTVFRMPSTDNQKPKFQIGDAVRLSRARLQFDKSYYPNWGTEIFYIEKRQNTHPPTYTLCDAAGNHILGGTYESELQKVARDDIFLVEKVLKKKGDLRLVHWAGFDNYFDSWVHKNDLYTPSKKI